MPRNPVHRNFIGRHQRAEEEIRQLRIRRNVELTVADLTPYLYVQDAGAGKQWNDYAVLSPGSTDPAGFYVDRGRCWLIGTVIWDGGSTHDTTPYLIHPDNPLPEVARPATFTSLPFTVDQFNSSFTPAPLGDANDAKYGAVALMTVRFTGQIELESTGALSNYQGRLRKSDGSVYTGIPDGTFLILDGISWPVA